MAYVPKNEREQYVYDLIINSYPAKSKIKTIVPWYGDWLAIAQAITPNQNLFFGKLVIEANFFDAFKTLNLFDPSTASLYKDLLSSLFGRVTLYLEGQSTYVSGVPRGQKIYDDFLFDDLGFMPTTYTESAIICDINGFSLLPWVSISALVAGSNNQVPFTLFGSIIVTNPAFVFAPNVMYFSGYKVIMEG